MAMRKRQYMTPTATMTERSVSSQSGFRSISDNIHSCSPVNCSTAQGAEKEGHNSF
jgi:hypothetical protein